MNQHIPNTSAMISNALREVSMIAEVKTTALGLTRTDKRASAQSATAHRAHQGAARVSVNRLAGADDLHKDITALQEAMRVNLAAYTTAWGSTGRRLLPNANFTAWITEHARLEGEFNEKLEELRLKAPELVARAEQALGEYDIQPPTLGEINNAYSVKHNLEPIPDSKSFIGMPAAAEEYLKAQFEMNVSTAYNEAQQDALKRLFKPLEALVERIEAYDEREKKIANGEDAGKTGIFRDTLVSNVQDIAAVFSSFNLLGDPTMTQMAERLKIFQAISPDDLRKDDNTRKAARDQAAALIEELNDLMLPMQR